MRSSPSGQAIHSGLEQIFHFKTPKVGERIPWGMYSSCVDEPLGIKVRFVHMCRLLRRRFCRVASPRLRVLPSKGGDRPRSKMAPAAFETHAGCSAWGHVCRRPCFSCCGCSFAWFRLLICLWQKCSLVWFSGLYPFSSSSLLEVETLRQKRSTENQRTRRFLIKAKTGQNRFERVFPKPA